MVGTAFLGFLGVIAAAGLALWVIGERGHLMRPSTWKMIQAAGVRRIWNMSAIHGYIYGRWLYLYIDVLLNKIQPRLGPGGHKVLADHYHAKVLTKDQADAIITVDQDIPLQDLEQIIPYPVARDIVLNGPPDLAALKCPCRSASDDPCEPTQVCLAIGQPFVDFMLEHHPKTTRRLSQTEALELIEAEHKRGHVHAAWFKDACLDRMYSICNCCSCCCGGTVGMKEYDNGIMASSGYVANVDKERCTACATCEDACPFDAIRVNGSAAVDWDACMGCGVCAGQCPSGAMTLSRDEQKGLPLDVRLLA